MITAASKSIVTLPDMDPPYPSLLAFFTQRFPRIPEQTWAARIKDGKIFTEQGEPVNLHTAYEPNVRLFYFREVTAEPKIPFQEEVLFANDHLLVACKPHFLPVNPGGPYIHETLLHRLQEKTANPALSPINRIDRATAGLVLFSMRKETRGAYQQLFMQGKVQKTYEALAHYRCRPRPERQWLVENRIVRGEPWFRMKSCAGTINARSEIRLLATRGALARFQLHPLTGKKHQLRIHLSAIGFPIVNDRCYPDLLPEATDDFNRPLQLLAKQIAFADPITGRQLRFTSKRRLLFPG